MKWERPTESWLCDNCTRAGCVEVRSGAEEENLNPGVLIVDDSLTVRMDLGGGLRCRQDFAFTLCSTLSEARKRFRQPPSPSSSSMSCYRTGTDRIPQDNRNLPPSKTPVMLLSSELEVKDRIRGLKTGADEYVGKPYDKSYVVARALELLRKAEPEPEGEIDNCPDHRR